MTNEVENSVRYNPNINIDTVDPNPVMRLNPQDLAELGALMVTNGISALQARAIIAKIQQVAAQVAMAMAPDILEEIRRIQEARILEMVQRVRILPNAFGMGYVNRDRVLQIITDVAARPPRP